MFVIGRSLDKTTRGSIYLSIVLIITIVILMPLADSLTGFLMKYGISTPGSLATPSQIVRLFLLFIIILLNLQRSQWNFILPLTCYVLLLETVLLLAHQSLAGYVMGLVFSYKLLLPFYIYYGLNKAINVLGFSKDDFYKIFVFTAIVYIAYFHLGNIVLFKSGKIDSIFRTTGLFSSGNGLGVLFGVFSIILLHLKNVKQELDWRYNFLYFNLLLVLILLSTKASIVFLILNFLVLFLRLKRSKKVRLSGLMAIALYYFGDTLKLFFETAFELIIFRYTHRTSLTSFLLGGRENYFDDAWANMESWSYFFLRLLFGGGSFLSFELSDSYSMRYKMLESDVSDIFFMYGLLGLSALLLFIRWSFKGLRSGDNVMVLGLFVFYMHSFLAGHTLFNGMSILGLIFILTLKKIGNKTLTCE